jgi:GAF domain-containing protein
VAIGVLVLGAVVAAFMIVSRRPTTSLTAIPEKSIAVLPFVNMSSDKEQDYVASNELLVVEDISRDKRFANNPLLKGRGLRFYAGMPLRVNKFPIGSICLLDTKPRRFSEENRRLLHVMAEEVTEELERRVPPIIEASAA